MTEAPTPTRLTDRKRDAIVQAAINEFRDHGFAGTSMDRVAASAEVSKRTVYNHFPSKDELFEAILLHLAQCAHTETATVFDAGQPLRAQLIAVLQHKLQLLNDQSFMDLSRVAMAELMHAPDRARFMTERLSEREEGLTQWIRAASQAGALRKDIDPPYAANQLHGLLKAFTFWPQIAMGQPPLPAAQQVQVVSDAVDMFLGFYAVPATDPAAPRKPAPRKATRTA